MSDPYADIDAPQYVDFNTMGEAPSSPVFEKAGLEAPAQAPAWAQSPAAQGPSPFSPEAEEPQFTVFAAFGGAQEEPSFNASAIFEQLESKEVAAAGAWGAAAPLELPMESPICAKPQYNEFVSPAPAQPRFGEEMEAEERMKRALAGDGGNYMLHKKSERPLTTPVTPQFATNKRLGRKEVIAAQKQRVVEEAALEGPRGLTVAQPFSFATQQRAPAHKEEEEPEEVQESGWTGRPTIAKPFAFATDQRAPVQEQEEEESFHQAQPPKWTGKLTVAHTPQLSTRVRARAPESTLTTEQRRELEVLRAPKFKARPVDRAVLEGTGCVGMPLIPKNTLTRPEEFNFATAARSMASKEPELVEEQPEAEEPAKRKRVPAALTVPHTPQFATSKRGRAKPAPEQPQQQPAPEPARKPFVPHVTVAKPFSFVSATANKKRRGQENENAHPNQAASTWKPGHLTEPKPFKLRVEQRGAIAKEVFLEQVAEEEARRLEMTKKKARPYVPVKHVFAPTRSAKPLTELDEIVLNSDVRAYHRQEFDTVMDEKRRIQALMDAERQRELEEREAREVRRMRARMVHKARPIMPDRPIQVHPSSAPLTVPQSPAFHTTGRKRFRN